MKDLANPDKTIEVQILPQFRSHIFFVVRDPCLYNLICVQPKSPSSLFLNQESEFLLFSRNIQFRANFKRRHSYCFIWISQILHDVSPYSFFMNIGIFCYTRVITQVFQAMGHFILYFAELYFQILLISEHFCTNKFKAFNKCSSAVSKV